MVARLVSLRVIVAAVVLAEAAPVPSGLTCLECRDVAQPRHCRNAVTCPLAHYCGSEKIVTSGGTVAYNVGCRHKEVCSTYVNHSNAGNQQFDPCLECCESPLCNAQSCGELGFPITRGPLCYQCEDYKDVTTCNHITQCATDELCYIEQKLMYADLVYSSGCKLKHSCSSKDPVPGAAPPVGKRFLESHVTPVVCALCCDDDTCNSYCGNTSAITGSHCEDISSCSYLLRHYDVCGDSTLRLDCPRSCGLCGITTDPIPTSYCRDEYGNCRYLQQQHNICGDTAAAVQAGCSRTCGLCNSGSTSNGSTTSAIANTVYNSTASASTNTTPTPVTASTASFGSPVTTPPPGTGLHDCRDVYESGRHVSGVYSVNFYVSGQLQRHLVYCDMDTPPGGWTVFQKRFNGSVDFYRTFNEYESGFGDLHGEFWLGLKWVYWMTRSRPSALFINLTEVSTGKETFGRYGSFSLGSPPGYSLHVSSWSGTATDQLTYQIGNKFYTRDHDTVDGSCAEITHAGYWFHGCNYSSLNGNYGGDYNTSLPNSGFFWYPFYIQLSKSQMAFRRT